MRFATVLVLVMLWLLAAAGPPPARAADAATVASQEVRAPAAEPAPQRTGPPATLRAYWHLFIAFALAWLLLFGYAVYLGGRVRRLDRELNALNGESDPTA